MSSKGDRVLRTVAKSKGVRALVFGGGGHSRVLLDILSRQKNVAVVGVVDRDSEPGARVAGFPVLGREADIGTLVERHGVTAAFVGIGDNWARGKVVAMIEATVPQLSFPTAIHPHSIIASDVVVGPGTVVAAGATINPGAQIGAHCIVNTGASIDHEDVLQDFVSVGPGAVLGGRVCVGTFTAIAIGALIVHRINVGAHTVVGAGATVLKDLPDHVVAYGLPARIMRRREEGEPYL